MRRNLCCALLFALLLAAPALRAEEKEHHCASHHWEMPQYRAETALQTKGLAAALAMMAGLSLRRRGRERRKR